MAEQQQHARGAATPLEEVKAKIAATETEIAEKKAKIAEKEQEIITAKKANGIYVILFRFDVIIIEWHYF